MPSTAIRTVRLRPPAAAPSFPAVPQVVTGTVTVGGGAAAVPVPVIATNAALETGGNLAAVVTQLTILMQSLDRLNATLASVLAQLNASAANEGAIVTPGQNSYQ